jgi:hypothetical protein
MCAEVSSIFSFRDFFDAKCYKFGQGWDSSSPMAPHGPDGASEPNF